MEAVEKAGFGIALNDDIPARIVYSQIREWMEGTFELSGPFGGWTFDGCTGYCPDCFQRPWCDTGSSACRPEDEEAGKMHLADELKDYVSAAPQSLEILRQLQAEEDALFNISKEKSDDSESGENWRAGMN